MLLENNTKVSSFFLPKTALPTVGCSACSAGTEAFIL